MLVAVEGVNLTGKSVLVGELAEAFPGSDVVAMPSVPVEFGSLVAYEDAIGWYDPLGETAMLLERSQLGEYVWPELERRSTDMIDPAIRRHVEMFMCSRGCVTIYATREYSELHEAWQVAGDPLRPAALALALERYDQALSRSHSRGFVFEHDHAHRHLSPKDVSFVAGQADDDVRPFYGVTHSWIGTPKPRWVIASSGYSDQDVPGRRGADLDPTIAHLLRNIPERAWRGVALVNIEAMSDEGLREFARLADAEAWITVDDVAKDRVSDIVYPRRSWSLGYAVIPDDEIRVATWNLWSGM